MRGTMLRLGPLALIAALGLLLAVGTGLSGAQPPHAAGEAAGAAPQRPNTAMPFYGMQYVPAEDLPKMKALGINVVLQDFSYHAGPAEWRAYLDAAHAQGLKVIPWLWPQGYSLDRSTNTWTVDPKARLFIETVAAHPALFAIYGLHEPYWNGCRGCEFNTAQLQEFYRLFKSLTSAPLYHEFGSIVMYAPGGRVGRPETTFADGICDYCQVHYFPFVTTDPPYERDELIAAYRAEIALARRLAPRSQIIWTIPTMADPTNGLRMPTAQEMRDIAGLVYTADVAGVFWYPYEWEDTSMYPDFLIRHPELHPTIREIYDTVIRPRQTPAPTPTPTRTATPGPVKTPTRTPSKAPTPLTTRTPQYLPLLRADEQGPGPG